MQTKKLLVSTLILATLGGTLLQVSPVFAVNRSTYSQGSTKTKSMVWELTRPTGTTMETIGQK